MEIRSLALSQFRNYETASVSFSPHCNVIFGENAQGKTNLLEAAAYLSGAKSHRVRGDRDLIRFGQESALVQGIVFSRNREFQVEIHLSSRRRRTILINGVRQKNTAGLSDVLRTVLFSPEDLFLIRAGAAPRRRFLDQTLCQLRPRYEETLAQYDRLYAHKTRILRDWEQKPSLLELLETFNPEMARCGAVLISYRAKYLKKLEELFCSIHLQCSGGREKPMLCYQTVSAISDPLAPPEQLYQQLLAHQLSHRSAELASKTCLSGPHKDDFSVLLENRPLKSFGSQGQVRTAALSLKLAEREMHFLDRGEYPVLFLDDVLSELDEKRQMFVLNQIGDGQIFITCCQMEQVARQMHGARFQIAGGAIHPAHMF